MSYSNDESKQGCSRNISVKVNVLYSSKFSSSNLWQAQIDYAQNLNFLRALYLQILEAIVLSLARA